MVARKVSKKKAAGHHESVIKFLYWRERAKDLASELKKEKKKGSTTKKFIKMVDRLDKIKLSDLGV